MLVAALMVSDGGCMEAEAPKLRCLCFCWEQHAKSFEGMRHSARPFQGWRLLTTSRDALACAWQATGVVLVFIRH